MVTSKFDGAFAQEDRGRTRDPVPITAPTPGERLAGASRATRPWTGTLAANPERRALARS